MTGRRGTGGPGHLREQLRELRVERTRITWWRRLVRARLDLAVARTAGPQPLGGTIARTQGDAVPAPSELMGLLHGADPAEEVGRLVELRDLDGRLGAYESQVDDALRSVGDDLVGTMARDPEGVLGMPPARVLPPGSPDRSPGTSSR
ncbi:hypothetical protein [Cellulomonas citrea]|uniref:hypothetical protein n=1 Tax=Cellulomonas citrea TaxID=1909423 RepID=UPI0019168DDB|nr:hypothetical protein [Cellulomonas citrea]